MKDKIMGIIMGAGTYAALSMGFKLAEGYMVEGYGLHPAIVGWTALLLIVCVTVWSQLESA